MKKIILLIFFLFLYINIVNAWTFDNCNVSAMPLNDASITFLRCGILDNSTDYIIESQIWMGMAIVDGNEIDADIREIALDIYGNNIDDTQIKFQNSTFFQNDFQQQDCCIMFENGINKTCSTEIPDFFNTGHIDFGLEG